MRKEEVTLTIKGQGLLRKILNSKRIRKLGNNKSSNFLKPQAKNKRNHPKRDRIRNNNHLKNRLKYNSHPRSLSLKFHSKK
jgi:hypothetical protein